MKVWIGLQLTWCILVACVTARIGTLAYHYYNFTAEKTASGQFYISSECMSQGGKECRRAVEVHHFSDVILPTFGWMSLTIVIGVGCLIGVRHVFGPLIQRIDELSENH